MIELMMSIEFEDTTGSCPVSAAQCTQWCETTLRSARMHNAAVSVRVVDSFESQTLNRTFRGKDEATNVLAFPADIDIPEGPRILGDIAICLSVALNESASQQKTAEQHIAHLLVHGCLHLLGYDHMETNHAEIMENKEIGILNKLGYPNPYLSQEP